MALAYEGNTDLAVNTGALREYGSKYGEIAEDLRNMAKKLDACLQILENSGWTTPAGKSFHKMAETDWKDNIEKYAALLDTLQSALEQASVEYDALITGEAEQVKW